MRAEEYMVLAEDSRNQGKNSLADFYEEWAEKCRESAKKYIEMQLANPPKTPENN